MERLRFFFGENVGLLDTLLVDNIGAKGTRERRREAEILTEAGSTSCGELENGGVAAVVHLGARKRGGDVLVEFVDSGRNGGTVVADV